jgi:hypothetical protein
MTFNEAVVIYFNALSWPDWGRPQEMIVKGAGNLKWFQNKNSLRISVTSTPVCSNIRNTWTAYFDNVKRTAHMRETHMDEKITLNCISKK